MCIRDRLPGFAPTPSCPAEQNQRIVRFATPVHRATARRHTQCNRGLGLAIAIHLRAGAIGEKVAGSNAEAVHRADNRNGWEEMSRHTCAATLLPPGLSSTPATPSCLA